MPQADIKPDYNQSGLSETALRNKISRFIFISNGILFVLVIVYYILRGLDDEELTTLISLLAPISAVYMGAVIKYAVSNKNVISKKKEKPVNQLYVTITSWAIPLHFGILLLAISAKALFNWINFQELKITFAIVESFFGAYIGIIVASLFKVDEE